MEAYFNHFTHQVRHILPASSLPFTDGSRPSPCLRFAMLCIAASNLSMLNARVQTRVSDPRRSVYSPLVNHLHHANARRYHNLALAHASSTADPTETSAALAARVLLAYYHHASTDHGTFRRAVADSVHFTTLNRAGILASPDGADALQMWYRLCTSHRPSKPPALLLEGEGACSYQRGVLPDATDHLFLRCIVGMSADDLIYDILIKTMEIRTKIVLFRSVAGTWQVAEMSGEIGGLAHRVWNTMLGKKGVSEEDDAREGFVRGSHLLGLLEVQQQRLTVWKSRLDAERLSRNLPGRESSPSPMPSHRGAMNALYCMICELAFIESFGATWTEHAATMDSFAQNMCQVIRGIDLSLSNTSDVYTLSLAEVLLQLVFLWPSDAVFHYILDVLWPQLERQGRGYEHSHYPTHLVKRIILQTETYWHQGQVVTLAVPAVAEDTSKLKLLDTSYPIDVVVCGYRGGGHYIEKVPLP